MGRTAHAAARKAHGRRKTNSAIRLSRKASSARRNASTGTSRSSIGTLPVTERVTEQKLDVKFAADGTVAGTPTLLLLLRAEMVLVIAFTACPQDILPINGPVALRAPAADLMVRNLTEQARHLIQREYDRFAAGEQVQRGGDDEFVL